MSSTNLEKRWGGGCTNPSESELRDALAELTKPDREHPDCWLSDENGWSISAYETGKVVLQNLESAEGPWHMENQSLHEVLTLWKLLQAGDLESIRQKPWLPGY